MKDQDYEDEHYSQIYSLYCIYIRGSYTPVLTSIKHVLEF